MPCTKFVASVLFFNNLEAWSGNKNLDTDENRRNSVHAGGGNSMGQQTSSIFCFPGRSQSRINAQSKAAVHDFGGLLFRVPVGLLNYGKPDGIAWLMEKGRMSAVSLFSAASASDYRNDWNIRWKASKNRSTTPTAQTRGPNWLIFWRETPHVNTFRGIEAIF